MLSSLQRVIIPGTIRRSLNHRRFSSESVHSVFPATLYRFQIHRESRLFDKSLGKDDWDPEDGVEVHADGLVHPELTSDVSNGARFRPNTHSMQQVTRESYEYYIEAVDGGKPAANPHLLCIRKGTKLPDSLVLYREKYSHFSLQPSRPMPLIGTLKPLLPNLLISQLGSIALNKTLTEFYKKKGKTLDIDKWLEENSFFKASLDYLGDWENK
ncbi:hypothetical protein POSPLADRAFT_1065122 [Postia placenta MAD-698-R-SB12]|uniref:Tse2 ADP-ribosyltransferase toxin domain-containing protein n=1 Tax=Postia placenta MAD-698-R-SB12 TaxID=670580 RepID=A0A1X6N9B4_9APHY|nr:hypothetical protein POSPLADRAFT_1065122 [Postia placenta MAD-698-R-SB12]OSX65191.1 hypothetical protein POSPLADRAFT_1065122 [Postia placenta MAD-698-R-SB12]